MACRPIPETSTNANAITTRPRWLYQYGIIFMVQSLHYNFLNGIFPANESECEFKDDNTFRAVN